jgi:hypothetical protein
MCIGNDCIAVTVIGCAVQDFRNAIENCVIKIQEILMNVEIGDDILTAALM